MADYDSFDDARIRHLDMIQAVIARLGTNGFVIKGWAITVAGAFLGFAVNQEDWPLAAASTVPTITFWILDAYFLRTERLFRCLFETVRRGEARLEPFFMSATDDQFIASLDVAQRKRMSRWSTLHRPALAVLYLGLVAAAAVVAVIIGVVADPQPKP